MMHHKMGVPKLLLIKCFTVLQNEYNKVKTEELKISEVQMVCQQLVLKGFR